VKKATTAMAESLIDTNVLSKIFYGDADVKNYVESLDAGIETIIFIECIQGSISNSDKRLIKRTLEKLHYYELTGEIGRLAIELVDIYSNAHGLFLADAVIAATALKNDLTLITYNLGDFKFIKDLKVQSPPF
jgi:predicted nucleic acid-binding protein